MRYQSAPFQLAVMDGGSNGNLRQIVDGYSDIITFFRSAPDKGQTSAIKEGQKKISGDIIAWLNADDYYFPGALDMVSACFENNPDIDVVYGDAIHVSPEGLFLSYFPVIQEFDAKDLTRTCFICQPACFVRREAYDRAGGLDTTLHYTMDWDLWLRLFNSGAKFHYLRKVLAAVRCYPGTKTLSGNLSRYKEIWRIERKYGRRLIPVSWLGAYLYDLSLFKTKSAIETFAFWALKNLRTIKRKTSPHNNIALNRNRTNYGFYPLDSLVKDWGTIHLPWYDRRKWSTLRLRVHPEAARYQVKINGSACHNVRYENGYLWIQLPHLETPHREIAIRCKETEHWRLFEFGCEFKEDRNEKIER